LESDDGVVVLGIIVTAIVAVVSVVGLVLYFDQGGAAASSPVEMLEEARTWLGGRPGRSISRRRVVYN
jgi:hypothetical protein